MLLCYVAGPYRGNVTHNIDEARKVAIALWEHGHIALCPHLNTAHFELCCNVADEVYLEGDLVMLSRCDAMVLVPDWQSSIGTVLEFNYAKKKGIPVYEFPDMPPVEPTK